MTRPPQFLALQTLRILLLNALLTLPFWLGCAGTTDRTAAADHGGRDAVAGDYRQDETASPQPATRQPPAAQETPEVAAAFPGTTSASQLDLKGYPITCQGELLDLAGPVQRIARKIQSQRLYYNSQKLSDCSGIFHRVLLEMRKICPNQVYPHPAEYRSSRDLARWYAQRNELILVKDPQAMARFIKPGAAMFYGRSGKKFANFTEKSLFGANGIAHMGVVVSVQKDARGRVVGYALFHGRSRGKYAAITWHYLRPPGGKKLPPFGNYNQQWVAVAPLLPQIPGDLSTK